MLLKLIRLKPTVNTTGIILSVNNPITRFEAFSLEPLSPIPEGTYKIILKKNGSLHHKYLQRFPAIHKGMLELANVPNHSAILIHIGNYTQNTKGCILVGNLIYGNSIRQSELAYLKLYDKIVYHLTNNINVFIEIS